MPASVRRSIIETVKIATETLEALFNMELAVPPGVVQSLGEGISAALQRNCQFILQQVRGGPAHHAFGREGSNRCPSVHPPGTGFVLSLCAFMCN